MRKTHSNIRISRSTTISVPSTHPGKKKKKTFLYTVHVRVAYAIELESDSNRKQLHARLEHTILMSLVSRGCNKMCWEHGQILADNITQFNDFRGRHCSSKILSDNKVIRPRWFFVAPSPLKICFFFIWQYFRKTFDNSAPGNTFVLNIVICV